MRGSQKGCLRIVMAAAFAGPVLLAVTHGDANAQQGPVPKRLCKPRIEWSGQGASRAEAQRKAIDGWAAAAAGQHGEVFTRWAIAGVARVSCSITPEGHRCRAAASPCRDLNDPVKSAPGAAQGR